MITYTVSGYSRPSVETMKVSFLEEGEVLLNWFNHKLGYGRHESYDT